MEETKTSKPVETEKEEKKVKVSIEGAVSGKRERGWTIQNKCRQIAQLKDAEKMPVVSLFVEDPSEVPEDSWQMIKTPDDRNLLCCQKTILMLSEVVMQPELDTSDQVVLRMHVLAPKEDMENKDIFWKTTWGRFMHLGSISWDDLTKEMEPSTKKTEKSTKTTELPSLDKLNLNEKNTSTKG